MDGLAEEHVSMMLSLVWRPVFPTLSICGGAVILFALAVFAWWRSRNASGHWSVVLLVMRGLAIATIAALLLGPSRELEVDRTPTDARLAILLDTSQSMLVDDCETTSRIAHAVRQVLDPAYLAKFDKDFEIDLQGFDSELHSLEFDRVQEDPDQFATGRFTNLAESVIAGLSRMDGNGDAMLVVSDGRDTADQPIQAAASFAVSKGIPVFTVPVGGASMTTDAAIVAIPMQDSLLPNEPGGLRIRVYQSGLDGRDAVVRIRQGETEEKLPVAFHNAKVVELQATIQQEQPGQYEYAVSLDPVGDETEFSNNAQQVFVEVMKRRLRVLVLEGQPFWDTKFLVQSLRKDEQIEIVQLTQVGERKREVLITRDSTEAPKLPETDEEWGAFDVVVLGRGVENVITERNAVALTRFVKNGGNLIFARGQPYNAESADGKNLQFGLAQLEPVVWSGQQGANVPLELTAAGQTGSWLSSSKMPLDAADALSRLPGLETLHGVASLKPATIVIASASSASGQEEIPAIVRMTAGRGHVVAILGEGTWKWSLLVPELQDLRGFYDQFWSNLIRWMALGGDFPPGQQAALQLSRSSVRLGDEMTIDVVYRFAPDGMTDPKVTITGTQEESLEVTMHRLPGPSPRYRGKFTPESVGVHRVVADTTGLTPPQLEAKFNVYDVNIERLHTASDPAALAILAQESGGATIETSQLDSLESQLARHRQSMLSPPRVEYVWDKASVMFLLLGWLGLEWVLRRVAGLW